MPRRSALHHHRPAVGRASRLLSCYSSHQRPSLSDIQELADKERLHTTDDDDIVLLVHNPTPSPTPDEPSSVGRAACLLDDEPIRIYVPLPMDPWIKQAARPTELGSEDVVSGGVMLRTSRTMSSSVVCNRPLPASSWMSEREGPVRRVA